MEAAPKKSRRWSLRGRKGGGGAGGTSSDDDSFVDPNILNRSFHSDDGGPPRSTKFRRNKDLSKDDSDPSLVMQHSKTQARSLFRRSRARTFSSDDSVRSGDTGEFSLKRGRKRLGSLKSVFKKSGRSQGASSDEEEDFRRSVHRSNSFDSDDPMDIRSGGGRNPPSRNVSFELDNISGMTIGGGGNGAGEGGSSDMLAFVDNKRAMMSGSNNDMKSFRSFETNMASHHAPGERARYSVQTGSRGGKRKFRVRPYRCFQDAVYMTEEEIYTDSLEPSKSYDFVRSYLVPSFRLDRGKEVPRHVEEMWGSPNKDGRIGAFRMEVLGAISLARTKPDVCVYIICGDAAFCTDVLSGYRSPMWPSQSKRAAVFPIHHAYAKIFVGVFDVKTRKNKDNDVFCGRVSLDVASLRPNTEYDITFPLRASSFVYDRQARGVIRLRFSLHWFNERAAVFSYLRGPKSLARKYPLVEGQPAIPCADPKTFRNVAVTVNGLDLPGKYSRNAFRATMREFNLYHQNLRQMVKILILDAVMYERPHVSLYLFVSGMHCVWSSSVRLVPAYFVGYLLILFVLNHQHYVSRTGYNLGYKPLTGLEIAKSFFLNYRPERPNFNQILLQKRTKRRKKTQTSLRLNRLNSLESSGDESNQDDEEIGALDHREFPFSDRDAYPKFAVEDALAPSSNKKKGSATRLHGRLSVYYTSEAPSHDATGGAGGKEEEDDDIDEDSYNDDDDETIVSESGMGDILYDMDLDNEDEDLEMEMPAANGQSNGSSGMLNAGSGASKRRLRVGPPQNNDSRSDQRIPPQVHLNRIEMMLHKRTLGIAKEIVHPPPAYGEKDKTGPNTAGSGAAVDKQNDVTKRKQALDEFDKMLGLHAKSSNPITRIASSFLGPLMRMIRIFLIIVRISFNMSTWRDPYLSFLVFLVLSCTCVFLIWFPWRAFFLLSTVASVGPQNYLLRWYLEKKEAAKLKKQLEEEDKKSQEGYGYGSAAPTVAESSDGSKTPASNGASGGSKLFGRFSKRTYFDDVPESEKIHRPPFRSDASGSSSSTKRQPRAVVIPYSRFKKDRFFDWPPDPTVSRATPMPPLYEDDSLSEHFDSFEDNGYLEPVPEILIGTDKDFTSDTGLRQRHTYGQARYENTIDDDSSSYYCSDSD